MPRVRLDERAANTRHTIRRTVDIIRDFVGDVRERFDLDLATEPRSTRNIGGSLGHRGSLIKTIPAAAMRALDIGASHVQNFARINREHVRRARRY